MKKILLFTLITLCTMNAYAENMFESYIDFKNYVNKQYGINFGLNSIFTKQYAVSGKNTLQEIISPYISMQLFDTEYGTGNLHFAMNYVNFVNKTSQYISDEIKVANQINYYDIDYDEFAELYYSHTFKVNNRLFSVGLGQLPLTRFDMISYDGFSSYFLNNALSQTGTFAYPSAGLGGYVSAQITPNVTVNLGAIDANNPLAQGIRIKKLNDKKLASFASIQYTPKWFDKYKSSYNVFVYYKPSVEKAPFNVKGWSVYLTQEVKKNISLFLRANGASGKYTFLSKSYATGILFDNLIQANKGDQLGLGYAYNYVNAKATNKPIYHKYEQTAEVYYNYPITNNISIRPDVQVYINPAFKKSSVPAVFSLGLNVDL